ncbi:MAG TPA: hypothetical protein DHW73_01005 [Pseudomonas sp.]|jgi:putative lipoic acid-binding regulatory protein|nr:hypothetical protein [Pseudomonadales bacterium]MBB50714.1 hypothetical protein [Pseudomonadales bacterium]MBU31557.1 hypothetical protein [Pseudomonadales bacterium]HCB44517.1 hypothetical protein [Pseudomonas sp.]HCL39935.1 hypothetical protein [Pseudomonas sp.]|tara:strand:+ start:1032 stop:1310 length:279 start_codon:yes stop_codon:yes gene_type:complete
MADVNEPQAPKIEFPCQYPIKVIGTAGDDFAEVICEVVERHAPGIDTTTIDVKDSKNGRFLSLRLVITATGQDQLEALHRDLKATGRVHMVL